MAVLVAVALAIVPWAVAPGRWTDALERQAAAQGLTLRIEGGASAALLPVPRIRLGTVTLLGPQGARLVSQANVTAEFKVLPLLLGRAEASEMVVTGADITLPESLRDEAGRAAFLDTVRRKFAAGWQDPEGRLILRGATVRLAAAGGESAILARNVSLVAGAARIGSGLDIALSGTWRDEPVSLTAAGFDVGSLEKGVPAPLDLTVSSRLGRIEAQGEIALDPRFRFKGRANIQAASIEHVLNWTGVAPAIDELDRPFSIRGAASLVGGEIAWPTAEVRVGSNSAEGALAIAFGSGRPLIRGTLAASAIDTAWMVEYLWPEEGQPLTREPLADYDLRLSAGTLTLGGLKLTDAAAGILVDRTRYEMSLARAGLAGGILKARLSAQVETGRKSLRGQATLERVDCTQLLGEAGLPLVVAGRVAGQATFEASGTNPASLMQDLKGRVSFSVRDGDLSGAAAGARSPAWRFAEAGEPAAAWRGRSSFDLAQLTLTLADGAAEIAEGWVDGMGPRIGLRGRYGLLDRILSLRAAPVTGEAGVEERGARAVEIKGPLDRLVVGDARP